MSNIQVNGQPQASIKVESGARSGEHLITPLLLSFPHSGEVYPDDFGPNPSLPFEVLDFPNDKYVDELYHARNGLGLASVHALFPRAYIDVNRHQHDIDAAMLEDSDNWYGRMQPTGLKSGTTLFWSRTKEIHNIYDRLLSNRELKQRLAHCFVPYHQSITSQIEQMRQQHGCAYVLDCHSMTQKDAQARGGKQRPQIDIGDRRGEACSPAYTEAVADAFSDQGYDVTINGRFVGGEMIVRYGWPEINQHILQVEIRRDLYLDEDTRAKTERFGQMQKDCGAALGQIAAFVDQQKK